MRRIRYAVAASLDGFIAGPQGEYDWITTDPDIDFAAIFARYDTLLIGRRTWEMMQSQQGGAGMLGGKEVLVFSRSLRQADCPGATVVGGDFAERLAELEEEPGKDVWLFGGGELFRSLAAAGLVDAVEVAVVPVMLGEGIPLLAPPAMRIALELTGHRVYDKSGIVSLEYEVKTRPSA